MQELDPLRVDGDVDQLWQVDDDKLIQRRDEQVVRRQVAVGEAVLGEGEHHQPELLPECRQGLRAGAALGEPGSGMAEAVVEFAGHPRHRLVHGPAQGGFVALGLRPPVAVASPPLWLLQRDGGRRVGRVLLRHEVRAQLLQDAQILRAQGVVGPQGIPCLR